MSLSYFFEGLHDTTSSAVNDESEIALVTALAAIKDDAVKKRIVTFIQDVSGTTVARQK